MATCEELTEQRSILLAALTADDATILAAQMIRAAHQSQLWYVEYNLYLQGCGGGGGSGSGFSAGAEKSLVELPVRTAAELVLIASIPHLNELHKQAVARSQMAGAPV